MDAGDRAGAPACARPRRRTRGWGAWSSRRTGACSRAPPSRRAAPTPRSSPWPRPAAEPAAPPSTPRSSRAPTPAARPRAPTPSWPPACPGRGRHRGPRPPRGGAGHRPPPGRRHRGRGRRRAPSEVEAQLAPYLKHRPTGRPWVVLKLAATLDGRTAAPDGVEPVDHRRRGPGRRPPPAGRERRRASSAPAPSGPTTPRSPCATSPGRRPAAGRPRPRPARRRVHPALELEGDLDDVLDELGRRGVLQALVEGGRHGGRRLPPRRASSTATCSTSPPPCSAATTAGRCSPGPARPPWTTCGGAGSSPSPAWATTCGSTWTATGVFTGLVEELGRLAGADGHRFTLRTRPTVLDGRRRSATPSPSTAAASPSSTSDRAPRW